MQGVVIVYGPFALRHYSCPICGSGAARLELEKHGRVVAGPFLIVSCSECAHVRVDPRIGDDDIPKLYDEGYYRGDGFDAGVRYDAPTDAWTKAEHANARETVLQALGARGGRISWIDVGCGTGAFVADLREHGIDGEGSDDSPAAIAASLRRGVRALEPDELERKAGSFDVASAIEVIEHVGDPVALLRYLRSLVRPGGIVYVHTENWNVVRHLPGTPYLMPEGHIGYFTPPLLRRAMTEAGLHEAATFDRSWFLWRRIPAGLKRRLPVSVGAWLADVATRVVPGFAPMPVGRRPPAAEDPPAS